MKNEKICPETPLRVLLPAGEIPDDSNVSKRTGEEVYRLRHKLTVWPTDVKRKEGEKPLEIDGLFLVGDRGSISQVEPSKMLHWVVSAEDFIDTIKLSWEPEGQ